MFRKSSLVSTLLVFSTRGQAAVPAQQPDDEIWFWLVNVLGCVIELLIVALPFVVGFFVIRWLRKVMASEKTTSSNAAPPNFVWILFAIMILGGCISCPVVANIWANSWHPVSALPADAERIEPGEDHRCVTLDSTVPPPPNNVVATYQICPYGDGGILQRYVLLSDGTLWRCEINFGGIIPANFILIPIQMILGTTGGFIAGGIVVFSIMVAWRLRHSPA